MAERRLLVKTLTLAALLVLSGGSCAIFAQSPNGSLAGKLTDLQSKPLSEVTVTLRNAVTGAVVRTTTNRKGWYRLRELEPGTYGQEAVVQAAIELAEAEPAVVVEPASAMSESEDAQRRWKRTAALAPERLIPETRTDEVSARVPAQTVRILPLAAQRIPELVVERKMRSRPDEPKSMSNLA